jgi:hypothetical protein
VSELGEGVQVAIPGSIVKVEQEPVNAKRIYLHAFRGDRSKIAEALFRSKLEASRQSLGPGPTETECLIYTGHVGISFEAETPIYGFNPDSEAEPAHQVIDQLKAQKGYPGKVTDDTEAFLRAAVQGLEIVKVEYVCSEEVFNRIEAAFKTAKAGTSLRYSFPGGNGDCNCATWPATIGLPIPSANGKMAAYMDAMKSSPKTCYLGIMPGS